MHAVDLESASLWQEVSRSEFPSVKSSQTFDVVIVGGGITGLTAAWLLKQAGKRVAVLEKRRVGDGETGFTTAHLTMLTDTWLSKLAENFGEEAARLAWTAGVFAIDTIEAIVNQESLDCQFQRVPGFLHGSIRDPRDERESLLREVNLTRKLGFDACFIDSVPVVDRPGLRVGDQALFHPLEYLTQLAQRVNGQGCRVFEESEAEEVQQEPLGVRVNGQLIRCDRLVIATHVPLQGVENMASAALFQTKIAGYSTYAISARIPRGQYLHATYNDTADPYDYLRISGGDDHDLAVFGGEDHKTGQHVDPQDRYAALEDRLLGLIPQAEITHRWSGQVIETHDGLPYIGPVSDEQFIATGFAGNGMTFGTIAGMMASDWVQGRENPWQELFSVDRKPIRHGLWDYLKENVDFPYHLVKGFLTSTQGTSVDAVRPGEGKVLKLDGERCAVSRSDDGELSICSAICTHMGCVVRWNGAEKTWDCPCHGSRFSTDGSVIAGPAENPLAETKAGR